MLSTRLISMVEDHWESIASRLVQRIRQDPHLVHIRQLPESELRDWGRKHAKNLGHWLGSPEAELAREYERLGRLRCQERVPLHECVHGLHLVKGAILDFVRDQGVGETSVEIYAEEELEHSVGRFFDLAVHHLVKGYEEALRQPGN